MTPSYVHVDYMAWLFYLHRTGLVFQFSLHYGLASSPHDGLAFLYIFTALWPDFPVFTALWPGFSIYLHRTMAWLSCLHCTLAWLLNLHHVTCWWVWISWSSRSECPMFKLLLGKFWLRTKCGVCQMMSTRWAQDYRVALILAYLPKPSVFTLLFFPTPSSSFSLMFTLPPSVDLKWNHKVTLKMVES